MGRGSSWLRLALFVTRLRILITCEANKMLAISLLLFSLLALTYMRHFHAAPVCYVKTSQNFSEYEHCLVSEVSSLGNPEKEDPFCPCLVILACDQAFLLTCHSEGAPVS